MLRRFGNILMLVAVLAATGTHWSLLQSVAWTRMLAANLRTDSFTAAVQKTFDGNHPCALCKAIAAGKQTEQKKECTPPMPKSEFPPVAEVFALVVPLNFRLISIADISADLLTHRPLTPPPRSSHA